MNGVFQQAEVIQHGGYAVSLVRCDDVARIQDLELARLLGFARPHDIRELVDRWESALGPVFRAARKTSARGGRPGREYLLTEEQALFITAKSETERATEILKVIIAVFIAARKGGAQVVEHTTPAAMPGEVDKLLAVLNTQIDERFRQQAEQSLNIWRGLGIGYLDLHRQLAEIRVDLDQAQRPAPGPRSVEALGQGVGLCRTNAFKLLRERPELRRHRTRKGWDVAAVQAELQQDRRPGSVVWGVCRCRLSGMPARAALAVLIETAWPPDVTTLHKVRDALGAGPASGAALAQAIGQLEGFGLLRVTRDPGKPVYLQLDQIEVAKLLDGRHEPTCNCTF